MRRQMVTTMYNKITKRMTSQNFSVNSHLLKFVSLCYDLRNNLLSNHTDDT